MIHHPTDGNAIAADEHYNQPRREDFDACLRCCTYFGSDGDCDEQHPIHIGLCDHCGDQLEDDI